MKFIARNEKSLVISDEAFKVVGEEGFEPPTLWSQTRCATKLRYSPTMFFSERFVSTNQNRKPKLPNNGVANEIRTRDHRNHNPGLYQLSYSHHYFFFANFSLTEVRDRMARLKGFEPSAFGSGGQRSIQLSYRRMPCRRSGIIRISPNAV